MAERNSNGRSGSGRSGSGRPSSGRPSSNRSAGGRSSSSRPSSARPSSGRSSDRDESRDRRSDSRRSDSGRTERRSDSSRTTGRPTSRSSERSSSDRRERSSEDRRSSAPRSNARPGARRNEERTGGRSFDRNRPAAGDRRERTNDDRSSSRRDGGRREDSRRDERPRRESSQRGSSTSRPTRAPSSKTGFDNHPRRGTSVGAPVGRVKERGGVRNREVVPDEFIEVAQDIDTKLLPKQVLAELRNISPKAADYVGKHLAAAMMALEDDDTERAYQHAIAARSQGSRLASVREMCGLAAYYNEKWAEALNEFRTYQRITGDPHFMPLMADCERGLGRPEKALNLAKSDQVRSLDADTRIEFRIVISGARADLKQYEAALATLECPELHSKKQSQAATRLRYAYANALLQLKRYDEARDWFVKTSLSDPEDLTDAAERAVQVSEM